MDLSPLQVKYPRGVKTSGGKLYEVNKNDIGNESIFSILYPVEQTKNIALHLIEAGFSDATPSFYKGEKFSLSRIIKFPWELHLRLFEHKNKGKIFAHVEISRKYFEHLFIIQPVVYEVLDILQDKFTGIQVNYEPENKIVKGFLTNYNVKLLPPENLIEWDPLLNIIYSEFTKYKENIREILDRIEKILNL
ncbi:MULTISPECIES: hypothetical protein [Acidiplasma]|uniref:Uncharacterized protein n=2 Tax=Acidiplasma TaxID=507753 RepID=A0A0Q0WK23_9ARCH|nr:MULTISPECIES: hypothetical protein [Acidiplasma]KJE49028.1 hypothetical protein TZ01_07185 [Acidiplasma sp. MBA-1]KPV44709.1 hypothetical protein SE19_08620 [Acidiplasma aeolicum]KQB36043.1 hypothetical protein AOG55_05010 [Acidiplasma cupricumulans]WMT54465.1 MAG: hypothetical protein RE470_05990 [Acidiplasma sp.]